MVGGDNIEALFVSTKQLPFKFLQVCSFFYSHPEIAFVFLLASSPSVKSLPFTFCFIVFASNLEFRDPITFEVEVSFKIEIYFVLVLENLSFSIL